MKSNQENCTIRSTKWRSQHATLRELHNISPKWLYNIFLCVSIENEVFWGHKNEKTRFWSQFFKNCKKSLLGVKQKIVDFGCTCFRDNAAPINISVQTAQQNEYTNSKNGCPKLTQNSLRFAPVEDFTLQSLPEEDAVLIYHVGSGKTALRQWNWTGI